MGLGGREIKQALERFDLSPSRALGQNFLTDPNIALKIARLASVAPDDYVLEVGPGLGSLTVPLANLAKNVVAIEFDRYVIPALEDVLASRGLSNVEIVCGDALEMDYGELLGASKTWKLVANLPYNISTPLVLMMLEDLPQVLDMVVMVQKEVGERMCATPGSTLYSQVALKLGYFARGKIISPVSRDVFIPKPNVDSVLVQVTRREETELSLDAATYNLVFVLARTAFSNRRQMVRRTLSRFASLTDLEDSGIDPTRRPQTMSLEEWVRLATTLLERGSFL